MKCRRARQLVFEFVDGLEDERARLELENHLAGCGECEKLASQVVRSMDLIHRAPVEKLDENFNWKVRLAIHKERQAMSEDFASQTALFKSWNLRYAASAVAGFVGIVAIGWMAIGTGLITFGGGMAALDQPQLVADAAAPSSGETADVPHIREPEGPVFTNRSHGSVVSQGAPAEERTVSEPRGAMDEAVAPMNLDSLVQVEMLNRKPAERVRYLEERIQLLNDHLEKCKAQTKQ
jgi:hypothetical protein